LPPSAEPQSEAPADESESAPGKFEEVGTETGDVLVWVPAGEKPRPLMVVAHGAGDGPQWHCAFWATVVEDAAFIACLRGRPLDSSGQRFYFPQHHDLDDRVGATFAAFERQYGARWTHANSVYVGYSQGATMGALLMPNRGSDFDAVLLIEGGYEQWPVKNAREFRESGGDRVFFACGTATCERGARRSVQWLERAKVEAQQQTAEGAGHSPAGAVGELSVFGLAWLVRDLPGWSP
jgi:predicted esterase